MKLYNKIKDFGKIGVGDILGNVFSASFWFYLASQIEPAEYGEIHWFLGIASIFSSIALLGTVNTITVYTAKKIPIQPTLNIISLIASAASSLIVIVVFPSFYTIDVGVILIAYVINALAVGHLLGNKQYAKYSKFTILQKFLTLLLGITFLYFFGYEAIIFALALSYIFHFKRVFDIFKESKINFGLLKLRIGFITNNYLVSILAVSAGQIDKIVIAPILGFAILGNYSLALQAINVSMLIPSIFYKYLLPEEASGSDTKKIKIIVVLFSILLAICSFIIFPIIITEFFPKFTEAINAIKIMSIVIIPTTVALIMESEFLGQEKSRIVIIGSLIYLVSLVIGMITLGSLFGVEGIAYSLILATILKAALYAAFRNRIRTHT